jgi:EAL domain-containing protein (putative c-di-GMP-specific phosphodiesterase class I)
LKIDRLFVSRIQESAKASAIVSSLVHLSHDLGIPVIAEGVEDEETLAFLRNHGCDVAQGYALGKPCELALLPTGQAGPERTNARG